MLRIVSGAILVLVAVFAGSDGALRVLGADPPASWWSMSTAALASPVLAIWLAAVAVHARSPRRLLDDRCRDHLQQLFLGGALGLLTLLYALPAILFLVNVGPDEVWTALGALLAVFTAAPLLMRISPTSCVGCGYDLRGLRRDVEPRCPECGAALEPAPAVTAPPAALPCADRSPPPSAAGPSRAG